MTVSQQIVTIAIIVLGTELTRFLPFFLFPAGKPTPKYIQYLGKVSPAAVFGMIVIYCLRNVSVFTGSHGIPGAACHCSDRWSASVEAANTAVYRRRNDLLYDFGADGVCCIKIIRQLRVFLNWRICHI